MLKDKKALLIVAHEGFRDEEYEQPRQVLEENGVEVVVASSSLSEARGRFGAVAQPNLLVSQAKAEDYDAIVFIGGPGSSEYFDDPAALKLAQDGVRLDKVVAAICIAPHTLANAGVLEGKKATVFSSEIEAIKAKGAVYTGADLERDEDIITACGPEAAKKFGQAIVDALSG